MTELRLEIRFPLFYCAIGTRGLGVAIAIKFIPFRKFAIIDLVAGKHRWLHWKRW